MLDENVKRNVRIRFVKEGVKEEPLTASVFRFPGVAGSSKIFRRVLQDAAILAPTDTPVHLTGETGTGKDMLARALHMNSRRRNGPFVELNCGAVPEPLLESELFGYVPGAFTGARKTGFKGKFATADGGTLFLDEICELSEGMQAALLKVLDHQRFTPIGAERETACDVRILTATNSDLRKLVQIGKLREDLYYRLYICPLVLPPLRSRREDIGALIYWYKEKHAWAVSWTAAHEREMRHYDWPGNIRQLFHTLDRLRVFYPERLPEPEVLHGMIRLTDPRGFQEGAEDEETAKLSYREGLERNRMKEALEGAEGQVSVAMKQMGMARSTFYRKMKKYGLDEWKM